MEIQESQMFQHLKHTFQRIRADWVRPVGPSDPALSSRRRRLMAAMMRHFGVDAEGILPKYWQARQDAERVCAECANEGRCRRWLDWGRANDAPRVFCPNAPLFDQIAMDAQSQEDR